MNPIKFPGSKTIDSFKRELNLLITNIIAKFKDSHKIGDLVVVSREDFLHYLGQQMITETYLPEPDTIDFAAGLGPMFLKLPREIRDITFGRLLASGHTEFLRASKILSKEGASLISKHGIYRTNIAFNSKANCPKLSQPVVDTVQNLHLRVNMRDYPFFGLGTFP